MVLCHVCAMSKFGYVFFPCLVFFFLAFLLSYIGRRSREPFKRPQGACTAAVEERTFHMICPEKYYSCLTDAFTGTYDVLAFPHDLQPFSHKSTRAPSDADVSPVSRSAMTRMGTLI